MCTTIEKLHEVDLLMATKREQMGNIAEVLDRAKSFEHPIKPNRTAMVAAGVLLGLGFALVLLSMRAFL